MKSASLASVALFAIYANALPEHRQPSSDYATRTIRDINSTKVEPCAEAASSWAAQVGSNPQPTISASLAYACQQSVPLGKQAALDLVDAIKPYLEWQSDSGYKADPPSDYSYPGYDMFGSLDKVKKNLQNDKYDNEYDFQADLFKTVFAPGHDGHFALYTDALAKVFKYSRPYSLVSISEDGESLPVIKLYDDVVANPDSASSVEKINGKPAAQFVQENADIASWNQDSDASYNGQFFQASLKPNKGKGFFAASGRGSYLFQGANTTMTFSNGTTATFDNTATVIGKMDGVKDGQSFYNKFCYVKPGATPPADKPVPHSVSNDYTVPGYPKPVMATKDGIVSGYFLEGEGLEDTAVIVLLAFENPKPKEFQAVVSDFFDEAVAQGKTKLVIDFQGNGGGLILLGYDFFRQLFPDIQEDGYSRWRSNKGFLDISRFVSNELGDGFDPSTSNSRGLVADSNTVFNYRHDLNLTNGKFKTFQDKFGPHHYKNSDYTALMRWNLSDPLITSNTTFGIGFDISGYRSRKHLSQPFEAHNIVMLYDGVCASTCTIASEMLRVQGGVKSIAMGGRPQQGPIQGVGGVKGSQVYNYKSIWQYAKGVSQLTNDKKIKTELSRYNALPILRSTHASLNVRDQILRDNVDDGLPAQFVREDADCRLYWTAPMVDDVTEVWKAAANSAFNGAKCAAGGINAPDKRSEGKALASQPDHIKKAMRRSRLAALAAQAEIPPMEDEKWSELHRQVAF